MSVAGRIVAGILVVVMMVFIPFQYFSRTEAQNLESILQSKIDHVSARTRMTGEFTESDLKEIQKCASMLGSGYQMEIAIGRNGSNVDQLADVGCDDGILCCCDDQGQRSFSNLLYIPDNSMGCLATADYIKGHGDGIVQCAASEHVHIPECYAGHNHAASGCHVETPSCRCGKARTVEKRVVTGWHWIDTVSVCVVCLSSGVRSDGVVCTRCGGSGYEYGTKSVDDYTTYYYCGDLSHGYGPRGSTCEVYVCGYTEAQHCRLPNDDTPICGPKITAVTPENEYSYTDTSFIWRVDATGGTAPYYYHYDVYDASSDNPITTGCESAPIFPVEVRSRGEYYIKVYISDSEGKVSDLVTADRFHVYDPPRIGNVATLFDNTTSDCKGYMDSVGKITCTHSGGKGDRHVTILLEERVFRYDQELTVSTDAGVTTVTANRDISSDARVGTEWQQLFTNTDPAINDSYALGAYNAWRKTASLGRNIITEYDSEGNVISELKNGIVTDTKPSDGGYVYRWTVQVTDDGGRKVKESREIRIYSVPVPVLTQTRSKGYVSVPHEVSFDFTLDPGCGYGSASCVTSFNGSRIQGALVSDTVSSDNTHTVKFRFTPAAAGEYPIAFELDGGLGRIFNASGTVRIYTAPSVSVPTGDYGYQGENYSLSVLWTGGMTSASRQIKIDWYFRDTLYSIWQAERTGTWNTFNSAETYDFVFNRSGYYKAEVRIREKASDVGVISNPAWAVAETDYSSDYRYSNAIATKEICVAAKCSTCGWYYLQNDTGWYDQSRECNHCPYIYKAISVTPSDLHVTLGTELDFSGEMHLYVLAERQCDKEGLLTLLRSVARSYGSASSALSYELRSADVDPEGWFTAGTYDKSKLGRQIETVYAASLYPMGRDRGGNIISPADFTESYNDYSAYIWEHGAIHAVQRALTVDVEPQCSICGRVYHWEEDGCPYCTLESISASIKPLSETLEDGRTAVTSRTSIEGIFDRMSIADITSNIEVTARFVDGHTERVTYGDTSAYLHDGVSVSGYSVASDWNIPVVGSSSWDKSVTISLTRPNGAPLPSVPAVSGIVREHSVTKLCSVMIHITKETSCAVCGTVYVADETNGNRCPQCMHTPTRVRIVLADNVCHQGDDIMVLSPRVFVTMQDGIEEQVALNTCTTNFDSSELGIKTFSVRYTDPVSTKKKDASFSLEIIDPAINKCPICGCRYKNRSFRICPICGTYPVAVEIETCPSTIYSGMELVLSVAVLYRAGNRSFTDDYMISGYEPYTLGEQHIVVRYHDDSLNRDFEDACDIIVAVTEHGYALCPNGHWYQGTQGCPYCEDTTQSSAAAKSYLVMYMYDILAEFDRQKAEGISDPRIQLSDGDMFRITVRVPEGVFLRRVTNLVFNTGMSRETFSSGFLYHKREVDL